MNKNTVSYKLIFIALLGLIITDQAQSQSKKTKVVTKQYNLKPLLNADNVSLTEPGPTPLQSMPVGNGDIGLNVWVDPSGELNFYIGKTDTWGPDVRSGKGLMKVGGVRVSLFPNPLTNGAPFMQTLKLNEGEIIVKEGDDANGVTLRIWVDANNPVIHVETKSKQPVSAKVTLNNWRLHYEGTNDTLISAQNNIAWYHRNPVTAEKHVAGLTYGAVIKGSGFVSKDDTTLQSNAGTSHIISIYPHTAQTNLTEWRAQLNKGIAAIDKQPLAQAYAAHLKWWNNFWHRSWVFFNGSDEKAAKISQGYILQDFITAAGGRGAYPIKFNGSIFTVDNPNLREVGSKKEIRVDPDHRTWGGQYWFQNTRAMYWPMLAAGNFDMMMPLFKMYVQEAKNNKEQVEGYYHHGGTYFAETAPFYGHIRYMGAEVKEDWTGHYFTPILELSMMMLDYYEYTGDKKFAKEMLVPTATDGLEFFDKHFKRDAQGKLLLDPDNAIEQYWKVHNPAPDIAGLKVITTRMLALPADLTDEKAREDWKRLRSELPELPLGKRNGTEVLFPYTTDTLSAKPRNNENPELYAIYPFRIYELGKPDLQLAINSFNLRLKHNQKGCWVQEPIQAAMLGLTDVAKDYTSFNLLRKDAQFKFPAFWQEANDYAPDQDNGGNGQNGVQTMLMLTEGKKIMLLPAWPKDWQDVDFKLHAPYNTTVQGKVKNGKLVDVIVTPASRKADVIDMSK
jgi:alpha-L-fucosidase 2